MFNVWYLVVAQDGLKFPLFLPISLEVGLQLGLALCQDYKDFETKFKLDA